MTSKSSQSMPKCRHNYRPSRLKIAFRLICSTNHRVKRTGGLKSVHYPQSLFHLNFFINFFKKCFYNQTNKSVNQSNQSIKSTNQINQSKQSIKSINQSKQINQLINQISLLSSLSSLSSLSFLSSLSSLSSLSLPTARLLFFLQVSH